jgi:hypothetical protein
VSKLRIVIGNGSIVRYPEGAGGGLWLWLLQYMLGLRALGHDVFWLELSRSTGDQRIDQRRIAAFLERFASLDLLDRCAVLYFSSNIDDMDLSQAHVVNSDALRIKELCDSADLLLNFSCAFRAPLLFRFRRRVHMGGDPGILQVGVLTGEEDLNIHDHHVHFTDGLKLHSADCQVPTLGLRWHPMVHPVYLPLWQAASDPGPGAPFTSVTQWWTGGELWYQGRVLSQCKRDGYLRYLELPRRAGRRFQLAANIHPGETEDRDLLRQNGWELVDPHREAASVDRHQSYIRRSRAELGCPKPVYTELRTGWFSERSAQYLASGRPVVVEDTGISDVLPVGEGILVFRNMEEAVAAVHEVDADYRRHAAAARSIVREHLDSSKVLRHMIDVALTG